jgi:hypothetical protein
MYRPGLFINFFFVYYESTKRDLKIRPIYECRCVERLKTKTKELKRLAYTGWDHIVSESTPERFVFRPQTSPLCPRIHWVSLDAQFDV